MKNYVDYSIAIPAGNTLLKPIIAALAATIVINGFMTFVTKLAGGKIEVPEALLKLKPLQKSY